MKLLTLAFFFCACTYSFTGANTGNLKSMAIPLFDNETPEPGIREKVTQGITQGILEDNTYKVADSKNADALLIGKITRVEDVVFAFEGSGTTFSTSDYKITITATLRMEQTKDKKILWTETISGWGRYSLSGAKRRNDGIADAVKMISQNVINKVVSDW